MLYSSIKGKRQITPYMRFEALLERSVVLASGCVIIPGVRTRPMIRIENGKRVLAARFLYEHVYGEVPANMCVLHKCHNKFCINYEHLYIGTHAENMHDKKLCGANAKLSFDDVQLAKDLITRGRSYGEVGILLGVCSATIRKACTNPQHPTIRTIKDLK